MAVQFGCFEIEVVIHPQSIVHSMVEFIDGSVMAQLGATDMRIPISYALAYPERIASGAEPVSFPALGSLTFHERTWGSFLFSKRHIRCSGPTKPPRPLFSMQRTKSRWSSFWRRKSRS